MVLRLNGMPLQTEAQSRTLETLKSLIEREPATVGAPDLGEKVSNSGIKDGLLPAEQVVPCAPYQIRACDLADPRVIDAVARTSRPCRVEDEKQISMFSNT